MDDLVANLLFLVPNLELKFQKPILGTFFGEVAFLLGGDLVDQKVDVLYDYLPRIYFGQPFIYLVFQSLEGCGDGVSRPGIIRMLNN